MTPDVLRVSGVIERFLPFLLVVIDISLTVCLQLVVIVQHLLVLDGLARVRDELKRQLRVVDG